MAMQTDFSCCCLSATKLHIEKDSLPSCLTAGMLVVKIEKKCKRNRCDSQECPSIYTYVYILNTRIQFDIRIWTQLYRDGPAKRGAIARYKINMSAISPSKYCF